MKIILCKLLRRNRKEIRKKKMYYCIFRNVIKCCVNCWTLCLRKKKKAEKKKKMMKDMESNKYIRAALGSKKNEGKYRNDRCWNSWKKIHLKFIKYRDIISARGWSYAVIPGNAFLLLSSSPVIYSYWSLLFGLGVGLALAKP